MSKRRLIANMPFLASLVPFVLAPCLHAQSGEASTAPLTSAQLFQQMDPQMANVVRLYDAIKGTPIINLTPQNARQQFSAEDAAKLITRGFASAAPMPVGKVEDGVTIEGRQGNQIPIRIYTPAGSGPFPVVVYFHGGGFVIATIDTYDASGRALCNYAHAIVVSVEYRKAPEAQFPAALYDAIDSYKWVIDNISHYNGVASKVAVAGESAGGNLATEVALAAKDENLQRPTHQLLIYPVASGNVDQPSDLLYTSSILPLSTPALPYFFKYYLPEASLATNPDVSPLDANLSNLAPTTIIAAQLDPLQSDGQAYAAKLKAAGNHVVYKLYPGVTHEFFGMGAVVDQAKAAEQFGAAQIAASF